MQNKALAKKHHIFPLMTAPLPSILESLSMTTACLSCKRKRKLKPIIILYWKRIVKSYANWRKMLEMMDACRRDIIWRVTMIKRMKSSYKSRIDQHLRYTRRGRIKNMRYLRLVRRSHRKMVLTLIYNSSNNRISTQDQPRIQTYQRTHRQSRV